MNSVCSTSCLRRLGVMSVRSLLPSGPRSHVRGTVGHPGLQTALRQTRGLPRLQAEAVKPQSHGCTWSGRGRKDNVRQGLGETFQASLGLVLLPALAPGSLGLSEYRWIFEDLVSVGSVGVGLPGLVSLGIFLNPMFEAMPRIRKLGHVGDMPMLPYSAMASMGSVWTAYGLLLSNPAVWTPNLCASLLGVYYMFVYCRHCPDLGHLLTGHVLKVLATMLFSAAAYGFLPHDLALSMLGLTGNVMTIFMFGGPLTAIRTVVREQNTRALNLGFTCAVNLNCILWFFYAYFMLDDPYIYLQDGVGIILATIQLGLFARYGVQRH
ncbi:unnamed protein product [Effrenium voratum]|uniref:Sugar transporter SWEET1 n=1 Tax=Effrenium voratum TaxID=2562239 RepID=A0AA36HVS2_9DINO|nr:unnamed protein product [Effrenium voratum]